MARVPSRGSDQFVVRFPEGMRDHLKRMAERYGRSMNAEILYRLEESLARDQWMDEQTRDDREPERDANSGDETGRAGVLIVPEHMSVDDFAEIMKTALEKSVQRAVQETTEKLRKAGGRIKPFDPEES